MAAETTNADMKLESSGLRERAEEQLLAIVNQLEVLLSPDEVDAFEVLQERWREYRRALVAFERLQHGGGTNAALSAGVSAVRETERWAKELRKHIRNRDA